MIEVRRVREIFDEFANISGIGLNIDKSVVIPIGDKKGIDEAPLPFKIGVEGKFLRYIMGTGDVSRYRKFQHLRDV